jgi:DNA repair exonuclease SbcCD ATPase subunit
MELENSVNAEVETDVVDSSDTVETESVNEEVAPSQEETEQQQEQTEKKEQSPEENAKFAEVRRKAEAQAAAKAKDDMIAEMYGESHGIYTYADYQKAVAEQREQEEMAKLAEEKEIPEDVAKELYEAKKLKEQLTKQQQEQEMTLKQQQEQQRQFQEFIEAFPSVQPNEIPQEVWDKVNNGVPLKYAYIEAQYNKIQEGKKAKELNQMNAEASTGSLKGKLDTSSDFISASEFENNRHDMDWVKANYNKIIDSRQKW